MSADSATTGRGWAGSRPPRVARSGRTLLAVGVIGQVFALSQLVGSWALYRQPFVVLGFWVTMSLALPLMTLVAIRAGGVLSGWAVLPMIGLLAVADVLIPAECSRDRISGTGWNWGAVAIVLLALAVYRPVLEVMAASLAHACAVVVWALLPNAMVDAETVVLIGAGAIIPPLAAAQFVNFYVGMISEREEAGRRAGRIEAREAAEEAVDQDGRRRLAKIRAEVVPVLQHVVEGGRLPLDAEHADAARRAADRLRSQLLEGRDVDWLLAATAEPGDDPTFEVRVVSDDLARQVLDDEIRTAVASLVGLLRRHRPWERLAVTLSARELSRLTVTVVATGDCAAGAARDPAIHTATRRLGADLNLVDERIMVIEGVIALVPA